MSLESRVMNPYLVAHDTLSECCCFPGSLMPCGAGKHPPFRRETPSVLAGGRNSSLCPVSFEKTRISQFAFMRRFHISFQLEGKRARKSTCFSLPGWRLSAHTDWDCRFSHNSLSVPYFPPLLRKNHSQGKAAHPRV